MNQKQFQRTFLCLQSYHPASKHHSYNSVASAEMQRSAFAHSRKLIWFPGHQSKALRELRHTLLLNVDLVIEVRDARIPFASANLRLDEVLKGCDRLIVLLDDYVV